MRADHIFISHSAEDDNFVRTLRRSLENQKVAVWVDSRNLRGGDKLAPEIAEAISLARHVLVVLGLNTINSLWVSTEIQWAIEIEAKRKDDGFKIIPLLLPGVEPPALKLWFNEERVAIPVDLKVGGISEAMPAILAALGERLPSDHQPSKIVNAQPVEELLLELSDPQIHVVNGQHCTTATAKVIFVPSHHASPRVESKRFVFKAPFGPIGTGDLRWYLEMYSVWPVGIFKDRANQIAAQLPRWGQALFEAVLGTSATKDVLYAWQNVPEQAEHRFSVSIDYDSPEVAGQQNIFTAWQAACQLLGLPWELLHNDSSYLFHGRRPVCVRRRLPNRSWQRPIRTQLPLRILLISPRPEDDWTRHIDHRVSARPLVEAMESLGELVTLTVVSPPTLLALQQALQQAADNDQSFDVVHFDGHGSYDREQGMGVLYFEDPKDVQKVKKRGRQLVNAETLAALLREFRIPLVFLGACQSAKTEENPTASIAAKLLEKGVASVVAMSHSVLVETVRRFVGAFYQELAHGARVGRAMLAGQHALFSDSYRGKTIGAGELRLQDWFVPVLYQEEHDPQLIKQIAAKDVQAIRQKERCLSLGDLPEPPPHGFHGRSRELLTLERLLISERYVVVHGMGGEGKTALCVELARWLVCMGYHQCAAFVNIERFNDLRGVLNALGRQLLPEGETWSVALYPDLRQAIQPIERALADRSTVIVLDNLECVLPDATERLTPSAVTDEEVFGLCQTLLNASSSARLVLTSRQSLPQPFEESRREIILGAMSREDAIELVGHVLAQEGLVPHPDDPGRVPEEIAELVEAVNCHARALVLTAREVARQGIRATTANLHAVMASLHKHYPDDREKSLYASVELSLRRLTPEIRERVLALGVFHGSAQLNVLEYVLDLDKASVYRLAEELISVGLAEHRGYAHLRLDPALSSYLLGQISETEQQRLRARWSKGMEGLVLSLREQMSKDAQVAFDLTLLELPNLLAMLEWIQGRESPEEVATIAVNMEVILARLGRPGPLARVAKVRQQAAGMIEEWSLARFNAQLSRVSRLMDEGALQSAEAEAQQLLQRCLAAGDEAYPEAANSIALAYRTRGLVQKELGAAEAALQSLNEAKRRGQLLADACYPHAEDTLTMCISEIGDCLQALGRLDDAISAYEKAIACAQEHGNKRQLAISKGQLASVYLEQQRFDDAIRVRTEAQEIFKSVGEVPNIMASWEQLGMIYKKSGQLEQAEQAYSQALSMAVENQYVRPEAAVLGNLGSLYYAMGRLADAVTMYRQSVSILSKLGQDSDREVIDRWQLAHALTDLGRTGEARDAWQELLSVVYAKTAYAPKVAALRDAILRSFSEQAHSEAERGNAQAQYDVGNLYEGGKGVHQEDMAEAVKWYRKGAEQGHAMAQHKMGDTYTHGISVAQDHAEAIKWYRKAAEQGLARSQLNLGTLYLAGQDISEALKWWRTAAAQNFALAQYNLGQMYEHGVGVSQDWTEAAKWYRLAAEQGLALAQRELGWLYARGLGVQQDDTEAVKWHRKAAEQGDARAQYNLALAYVKGEGVEQDYTRAYKWFSVFADKAKDADRENAVDALAWLESRMTPKQVTHTKAQAQNWHPVTHEVMPDS